MRDLKPEGVIDLIEIGGTEQQPLPTQLRQRTSVRALLAALDLTEDPTTLNVIAYELGDRRARSAVPALLRLLDHPHPRVRCTAADAVAKVGSPSIGPTLVDHYQSEHSQGVRTNLVVALGAVGYRPAVPILIHALADSDQMMRQMAAWSLGALGAVEAQSALHEALACETDPETAQQMRTTLEELIGKEGRSSTTALG